MKLHVLLVDDHDLVRLGIRKLLAEETTIKVVGEAASGEEAIEQARIHNPNIILMDVKMPGMDGLEATRRIKRINPDIKVLAVTAYGGEPYPSRVLQAGADGYLTKGVSVEEMIRAIKTVSQGHTYLSPEVAQELALKHLNDESDSPFDSLSEREMQVLIMIVNGQKVPEIANQLCLSTKTVNSYRYRMFEKLNVNSDVELTHLAIKYKLVEVD